MAFRVRRDGSIVCAAMFDAEPGDTYIDDGLAHELAVTRKLLVSEPMEMHQHTGRWWWRGSVPEDVTIDPFFVEGEVSQ
jgi:hypothetical protein